MRLLTAEADHNVGARRLLAIEYIDGNDCTSRDYVYAMKVLVTTPQPIKNDSEVTAEMVNVLRSIMPPAEEERTSKFTAAEWMAVQPSSVATQDPFKLSFLAASTLCGGLREKIKKQGDEPFGEPVWVETTYNAYLLLQGSTCHQTTNRSTVDRCQRLFGVYTEIPYSPTDGFRALSEARYLDGTFSPVFEITDMYSPRPNRIRLNEVYEADGSHSELRV